MVLLGKVTVFAYCQQALIGGGGAVEKVPKQRFEIATRFFESLAMP